MSVIEPPSLLKCLNVFLTFLHFGDQHILASTGVQQGDPLTLCFSFPLFWISFALQDSTAVFVFYYGIWMMVLLLADGLL